MRSLRTWSCRSGERSGCMSGRLPGHSGQDRRGVRAAAVENLDRTFRSVTASALERLAFRLASVGTTGDSYDNALAASIIGRSDGGVPPTRTVRAKTHPIGKLTTTSRTRYSDKSVLRVDPYLTTSPKSSFSAPSSQTMYRGLIDLEIFLTKLSRCNTAKTNACMGSIP